MHMEIKRVGIVGAGQMGSGIAQVCATAGLDVLLNDRDPARLENCLTVIEGSLARLGALRGPRRILIHVNNTNPLLREDSAERAAMRAAGVELAHDGLELSL